jgi:hypothetical protein
MKRVAILICTLGFSSFPAMDRIQSCPGRKGEPLLQYPRKVISPSLLIS